MNKTPIITLILLIICLCGFIRESVKYEQITFDYFLSDILPADFADIDALEFKGQTESSFTTLGSFRVCLKPADKLQSLLISAAYGPNEIKPIEFVQGQRLKISAINEDGPEPKLYIYSSVHVADNYYVFVLLANRYETFGKYVVELSPDGEIIRSCRMK